VKQYENMVLLNALGITNSGGITVLQKCLNEVSSSSYSIIICYNSSPLMDNIIEQFINQSQLKFIAFPKKNFLHRLWIENLTFHTIIRKYKVTLIYNFSGSAQFFMPIPQLIKLQNLMFFSKKLDSTYFSKRLFWQWLKAIKYKRQILSIMYFGKKYFEIQSEHVKSSFSEFISIKDKTFYLKSDIDTTMMLSPKNYDFSKKVIFFFIIGPHFEVLHKNLQDFIGAMLELQEQKINFEIRITLTLDQLNQSKIWDKALNHRTQFLGYLSQYQLSQYFQDNTILISTSIIETLGLHVIEAIEHGTIPIVPNEEYVSAVYGTSIRSYSLFESKSLIKQIYNIIECSQEECSKHIIILQDFLDKNEKKKYTKIGDIFDQILGKKHV
jgi:hypothetical protein